MKCFNLLILCILLFSCNLGIDNGDDVVGLWKAKENISGVKSVSDYRFNNDNYGNDNILADIDKTLVNYSYFKWTVNNTFPYKTIVIENYIHSSSDILKSINKYNYYFNSDKKELYLRNLSTLNEPKNWLVFDKW